MQASITAAARQQALVLPCFAPRFEPHQGVIEPERQHALHLFLEPDSGRHPAARIVMNTVGMSRALNNLHRSSARGKILGRVNVEPLDLLQLVDIFQPLCKQKVSRDFHHCSHVEFAIHIEIAVIIERQQLFLYRHLGLTGQAKANQFSFPFKS